MEMFKNQMIAYN